MICAFDNIGYGFTYPSTHYNRLSCRSCGARLVLRKCNICKEPILWHCEECYITYDSIHDQHLHLEASIDC